MKLNKLLEVLGNDIIVSGDTDIDISALAYDSRKVEPGCLFVAIPGTQVDGHNYIQQAIDAGAVAIVGERNVDTGGQAADYCQRKPTCFSCYVCRLL